MKLSRPVHRLSCGLLGLAAMTGSLAAVPEPPPPGASETAVVTVVVAAPAPGFAEADPAPPPRTRPAWQGRAVVLGDQQLDRLRGGFQTPGGLWLSFGIERVVYVNGNLTTSTRISVEGLGTAAGPATAAAAPVPAGINPAWVHGAAGGMPLQGLPSASSLATVIQNSMSDQHIQTLTIINASTNSLNILRGWSLQLSIRDAVTGSLRR